MPSEDSDKHLVCPDLNSLIVTAGYKVPIKSLNEVITKVRDVLGSEFTLPMIKSISGEFVEFFNLFLSPSERQEYLTSRKDSQKEWDTSMKLMDKSLEKLRKGVPVELRLLAEQHLPDGLVIKIECIPTMYYSICRMGKRNFHEQDIQEAQIECSRLIEKLKVALGGQEIMPPTVGPFIKRTEIKSRLLNLGLTKAVEALDIAEKHILQQNFPDALGRCREALEKTCSWVMGKCGLEETDSYAHNLDRLQGKGFLDDDTAEMLRKCYTYLARVGTPHEKGAKPGLLEAHLSLNMTLTVLDYLAIRFG
jgi:hypothetical protein